MHKALIHWTAASSAKCKVGSPPGNQVSMQSSTMWDIVWISQQFDGSNSFPHYSIDCVEVPRSSLLMYIDCVYCIVFAFEHLYSASHSTKPYRSVIVLVFIWILQAYVERIFSLCGLLTAGRRNRMSQNLEMRAFVKLNNRLVD